MDFRTFRQSTKQSRQRDDKAYPADTTTALVTLISEFEKSQTPIHVSFRELVPWVRSGERATHYVHAYPAKLLPQICHFFFAAQGWLPKSAIILDPFSGTGTVPLEANLSGRSAFYADANPLACLITRAKTTSFDLELAKETMGLVRKRFAQIRKGDLPWIVNVDHWYLSTTKLDLARLRAAIQRCVPDDLQDFFWATFSAVARKCSLANPRFSVPVLDKGTISGTHTRDVLTVFSDQFQANLKRHFELQRWKPEATKVTYVGNDARQLKAPTTNLETREKALRARSIDLILTSPPYAGAQKYVRASSLSLGWLGLTEPGTLKKLENASIGREHFKNDDLADFSSTSLLSADQLIVQIKEKNPLRAKICETYLIEMNSAIREMARVLKPNGRAIIVIGDNTVCGYNFCSTAYIQKMFEACGIQLGGAGGGGGVVEPDFGAWASRRRLLENPADLL